MATLNDRLDSFRIYKFACQLFDEFWNDSETLGKDYRGRELVKQQVRSLDSICANIEEGYGRGFGKELSHHLRIARGEARE
ncbi:MAG TPA: four helix bundle protein, partial [Syntrophales bacterium]|nr:four helix bundle protein [Syntrophales bacterium]